MNPAISVLMPTYNQAAFIGRALESLVAQTLTDWELVIVDDGSTDQTQQLLAPYLGDPRISYRQLARNHGLGAALNVALDHARAPLIAYLPSDDVYYPGHLASLRDALAGTPGAVLAYAGARHHYNRRATGQIAGEALQLVQVLHHRTDDRWLERDELVTDDLERMFWARLRGQGAFAPTGAVSCEWVAHPHQRHTILREPIGGINPYRQYYGVDRPLRYHTTVGNRIDEVEQYRRFRERPDTPRADDGLTILLVGELAYNADRVLALEERGHKLYGLWMPEPHWYNTVGPVPFGHVTDLPRDSWRAALRKLRPDIIYGLLNWQAVPFAQAVLREVRGTIPFAWHFKEGPFICLERGTWPALVELYATADGRIYSSPEMRDWFNRFLPPAPAALAHVLDGDLPKRDWFTDERAPLLSASDGEPHTVVPGRPIGLHAHTVGELAAQRVHLHFYGDFTHGQWRDWIERARGFAGDYLHLHPHVDQAGWTREFSRYDAGWLHFLRSENDGDLRQATWDDLNYPARIATLAAAGLPLLQCANPGAAVATQTLARRLDNGLFFGDMAELGEQLRDAALLARVRENAWQRRWEFTFDHHADDLVAFFRQVIGRRGRGDHA